MEKAARSKADRQSSSCGIIESIYCENFMCHKRLEIKLGPNMNFITGENGSGKSAIVAALQVCLGAQARTTHRGTSIKGLIRHGAKGGAKIQVTLRNKGVDAYRVDEFGESITVERRISRNGTSS